MYYRTALRLSAVVVGLGSMAGSAQAAQLFLSTDSSDETPAELLDAIYDFVVAGTTLTLTVSNTTTAPNEYAMNEVYFNGDGSFSLSLDSGPAGWSFSTDQSADGFGTFDFALTEQVGSNEIPAGGMGVFTFTITGSATMDDFVSNFSSIPPGNTPALAAGKWVQGPNDDSAFGAVVPTPGAIGLLAMGGLVATRRRRR